MNESERVQIGRADQYQRAASIENPSLNRVGQIMADFELTMANLEVAAALGMMKEDKLIELVDQAMNMHANSGRGTS